MVISVFHRSRRFLYHINNCRLPTENPVPWRSLVKGNYIYNFRVPNLQRTAVMTMMEFGDTYITSAHGHLTTLYQLCRIFSV